MSRRIASLTQEKIKHHNPLQLFHSIIILLYFHPVVSSFIYRHCWLFAFGCANARTITTAVIGGDSNKEGSKKKKHYDSKAAFTFYSRISLWNDHRLLFSNKLRAEGSSSTIGWEFRVSLTNQTASESLCVNWCWLDRSATTTNP